MLTPFRYRSSRCSHTKNNSFHLGSTGTEQPCRTGVEFRGVFIDPKRTVHLPDGSCATLSGGAPGHEPRVGRARCGLREPHRRRHKRPHRDNARSQAHKRLRLRLIGRCRGSRLAVECFVGSLPPPAEPPPGCDPQYRQIWRQSVGWPWASIEFYRPCLANTALTSASLANSPRRAATSAASSSARSSADNRVGGKASTRACSNNSAARRSCCSDDNSRTASSACCICLEKDPTQLLLGDDRDDDTSLATIHVAGSEILPASQIPAIARSPPIPRQDRAGEGCLNLPSWASR